ncbi:MAG: hypothetical protein IBJ00_07100 [Alphaproteobacteria bacterium]|nr:hypothetical protein [Alphaproteobacteria bacterium]
MRFYILVSTATMLLINFNALAASKAFHKRGASCTDHCTIEGKHATKDLILMGFHKTDIGTNMATLKEKLNFINHHCKILSENEKIDAANALNYHWCTANCMEKGGTLSKIKGRKEKVKSFIDKRKVLCSETMEKYAEVFHQFLHYDRARNMLVFKN